MGTRVRINAFLQEFAGNREIVEVSGKTVGECLDNLEIKFPGFKKQLGRYEGQEFKLFPDIMIYINSENSHPDALAKPVKNSDELTIGVITFGG